MKRVIYTLILALIFALTSPLCLLAETGVAERPSSGDDAVQSTATTSSDEAAGSLLESIVDAVCDLLDPDSADSEEPLNDVHPPDWNPPSEKPDGDDNGWDDLIK